MELYYHDKLTDTEWEGAAEDSPTSVDRLLASIALPSGDPFATQRA